MVLYAFVFLTLLFSIYMQYSRLFLFHQIIMETKNIASIIDLAGSSPYNCTISYVLPDSLTGVDYVVEVKEDAVLIQATYLGEKIMADEPLLSGPEYGVVFVGGDKMIVEYDGKLEVIVG